MGYYNEVDIKPNRKSKTLNGNDTNLEAPNAGESYGRFKVRALGYTSTGSLINVLVIQGPVSSDICPDYPYEREYVLKAYIGGGMVDNKNGDYNIISAWGSEEVPSVIKGKLPIFMKISRAR